MVYKVWYLWNGGPLTFKASFLELHIPFKNIYFFLLFFLMIYLYAIESLFTSFSQVWLHSYGEFVLFTSGFQRFEIMSIFEIDYRWCSLNTQNNRMSCGTPVIYKKNSQFFFRKFAVHLSIFCGFIIQRFIFRTG